MSTKRAHKSASLLALLLPLVAAACAAEPEWVSEARGASTQLGAKLIAELDQAIAMTGPLGAVQVCNTRAPQIAASVSSARLNVGRTALLLRNADNRPDHWERTVLERFDDRLQQGEDPAGLETWQVSEIDGHRVGRYMKAIPTAPKCLICHGESLSPSLEERIRQLYPADAATGFAAGDLRGAFTVTVDVPASE